MGHFRMGECPDLGVMPAGREGCFEERNEAGWGWGCYRVRGVRLPQQLGLGVQQGHLRPLGSFAVPLL